MRMWNVDVKIMCRRHLLGEHLEMHIFRGHILKGKSITGFLMNHLVNLGYIKERHDEIEQEMNRRGWNHNSPLEAFDETQGRVNVITIDPEVSLKELILRCKDCKRRYEESKLVLNI